VFSNVFESGFKDINDFFKDDLLEVSLFGVSSVLLFLVFAFFCLVLELSLSLGVSLGLFNELLFGDDESVLKVSDVGVESGNSGLSASDIVVESGFD
jgi:hypothetical protein